MQECKANELNIQHRPSFSIKAIPLYSQLIGILSFIEITEILWVCLAVVGCILVH